MLYGSKVVQQEGFQCAVQLLPFGGEFAEAELVLAMQVLFCYTEIPSIDCHKIIRRDAVNGYGTRLYGREDE